MRIDKATLNLKHLNLRGYEYNKANNAGYKFIYNMVSTQSYPANVQPSLWILACSIKRTPPSQAT